MVDTSALARTYWAHEPVIMGGAFPGDLIERKTLEKLRAIHGCGVRTFINLMPLADRDHSGELFDPYESYFPEIDPNLAMHRFPIVDLSIPSFELMDEILAAIDSHRSRGAVYVHCWGGRGRTGTVVGAYLIREGLATPENFVEVIRELRRSDTGGGRSPETPEQIQFVKDYVKARKFG